ncbi:MAG: GTPase ObgE [Bdellovibrionales bacterium]|nr:GTPase ObgE [Bdellovibrionales bacterium]
MKFIDKISIHLSSGKGGPGCASFASDPLKPRGGPDGGDGGRGGDVVIRVNPHLNTLFHLRGQRTLKAKNGLPGGGGNCTGASGEDLIVEVPAGTTIRDENGHLKADLTDGEIILLTGGRGGKGNSHFKTSIRQAPTHAQTGEVGEELDAHFELKLIADVGVIGFPNAGKSTLISVLTAAKPKIADYPFTTLQPQLGVVSLGDGSSFVIADIPGLIEGASEGVGLGHQFLQHIERTKIFIHLLDGSDFSGRDVWDDFEKINHELLAYDDKMKGKMDYVPLAGRPQVVVLNKVDSISEERLLDIEDTFRKNQVEITPISAATRHNLPALIQILSQSVFGKDNHE